jgi:hypothetical protein
LASFSADSRFEQQGGWAPGTKLDRALHFGPGSRICLGRQVQLLINRVAANPVIFAHYGIPRPDCAVIFHTFCACIIHACKSEWFEIWSVPLESTDQEPTVKISSKSAAFSFSLVVLVGTTAVGCAPTTDTAMSETAVYHAPEAGAPAPLLVAGALDVTTLTTTSENSSSFAAIDGRRELQWPAFP